jgi:hypothetical protein
VNGAGVHSAILNLKRPGYPWIAYQVLNTVVAAEDFSQDNNYTVEDKEEVPRPGTYSMFVRVPAHTPALRVGLSIPDAKPTVRVSVIPPDNNSRDMFGTLGMTEKGRLNKTIKDPIPGVWEIVLYGNNFVFFPEQLDSKPLAPVPAKVSASLIDVEASETVCHVAQSALQGCPTEVTFSNKLGAFRGGAMNAALGSARQVTDSISPDERRIYDIDVPPGSERLSASIGHLSDPAAEVDLYLFQEIKGVAALRASNIGPDAEKTVEVNSPGSGHWKVVVDAFNLHHENSVSYSYRDVFSHAAFGTIVVDSKAALQASRSEWKVQPKINLGAMPVNGRRLVGLIPVFPMEEPVEASSEAATPFEAFEKKLKEMNFPVGAATLAFQQE